MEPTGIEFSRDELIKLLEDAQQPENEDGVMTGPEICAALDISITTLYRRLDILIDAGLVTVGKKTKRNRVGVITTVPGYKLDGSLDDLATPLSS